MSSSSLPAAVTHHGNKIRLLIEKLLEHVDRLEAEIDILEDLARAVWRLDEYGYMRFEYDD